MNWFSFKLRPVWERVPGLLTAMKTGLLLLLTIGVLASAGSLIPQGEPAAFYTGHYGGVWGRLIVFLALDHMYRSWWFISLGILLMVSILACSAGRMKKLRGISDAGSVLLHLGIPVILAGAFMSWATGHSGYIEIGAGGRADLSEIGFQGKSLSVSDFKIEYYENGDPKQYLSDITLHTENGDSVRGTVSVNQPFKSNGIKIYQKSYGWLVRGTVESEAGGAVFDMPNGEEVMVGGDIKLKAVFIPDFDERSGTLRSRSPAPNNPRLAYALIKNGEMLDMQLVSPGETKNSGAAGVTFSQYGYYSGLEIKRDPAITVVYAGFIAMTAGFALKYFSARKKKGGVADGKQS